MTLFLLYKSHFVGQGLGCSKSIIFFCMVLRLFYHHILQQYIGIYSVSIPYQFRIVFVSFSYRSPIVLLSFSYRSPIILLLGNGKQYGNNTESNERRTNGVRRSKGGLSYYHLFLNSYYNGKTQTNYWVSTCHLSTTKKAFIPKWNKCLVI